MPKNVTERIIDRDFRIRKVGSAVISSIGSYPFGGTGDNDGVDNNGNGNNDTSNTPVPIDVTVTPGSGISASGFVGGTFTGSQVYTITNNGTSSISWTAVKSADWITVSSASGTLAGGASTTTTIEIDGTAAALLEVGSYYDVIIFNAEGYTVDSKIVQINVLARTLDSVIRGVIQPVQGDGDSASFTIPSWAEIGDLIYVYSYNRTYASYTDAVTEWTNSWDETDMAVDPGGTLTVEWHGSTWDEYSHVVESGDAGTTVTFDYKWAYEGIGPNPTTFANPIVCGVVFKGDWEQHDGNYGGVGYDYDYDNGAVTYTAPYQVIIYFNGLYGGGAPTPAPGATTLCEFAGDSSVFLAAKMAHGSGSEEYHIQTGNVGLWMIQALTPFVA